MTSTTISDFLEFLRDCSDQYNVEYESVGEKDKETQDLLHELELQDLKYHQQAHLAADLKQVREDRRNAKDAVTVLEPIRQYYNSHSADIKALERLLGEVRKAEKSLTNRIYIPRVRKDVHK